MLHEAELFVMAEPMLVEVLGRIREQDRDIVVPTGYDLPGLDADAPLRRIVERYVHDDAEVPDRLGAASTSRGEMGELEYELREGDPQIAVARVSVAAVAAASAVVNGATVVQSPYGELSMRDYLLRVTVSRSLLAHYVAAYLGSTACPLPEALGRSLWELTKDDAEAWRQNGVFREPLPIPEQASWRDVFLRTAGHEPHPLGH